MMYTFDTEAEFEAAVMRVIRESLSIDKFRDHAYVWPDGQYLTLKVDGENISSVSLD